MNINLLPTAVLEWLKNQGSALLQPGKAPQPNFETGKTYQAQVLASLPNGRHIVQVDNQVLDMSLPKTTRQGDTLNLTYLKEQPRATFLLTPSATQRQGEAAAQQSVRVSDSAGKIAALASWAVKQGALPTAAATPPPTDPAALAAQAKLATTTGPGGNIVATLTQANTTATAQPTASPPPQTNQTANQTLQPGTTQPGTTQQAASALQAAAKPQVTLTAAQAGANPGTAATQTATQTAGQNPNVAASVANAAKALPEALLATPRAGTPLPPLATSGLAAGNPLLASHRLAAPPLVEQSADQAQAWLAPLRQAVKESGMFYEANLQRWASGQQGLTEVQKQPQANLTQATAAAQGAQVRELGGMHEDVARLAGRQLQMLEGQPFVWQGLAWPGQPMQWQVEERPGGNGRGEQEEEAPWRTQLRLTLPRLGGVLAEIDLAPHGIKLKLAADSADALAELRDALPQLTGRMDAAGLSILGVALDVAEPEVK